MPTIKRYKVKLNNKENIEELLQEIYNEACKNIEEAQVEINKISESTDLTEEILDGKAKYAKAINDFITTKDKAIGRKIEISKLMSEVLKFNGNVKQAFTEGQVPNNWADLLSSAEQSIENKNIEYKLK